MNKFTFALALGAGLVLEPGRPDRSCRTIVQDSRRRRCRRPSSTVVHPDDWGPDNNCYTFMNTHRRPGSVESQVFQGTGADAGLTAYAYQFDVNNVTDNDQPADGVNSTSLTSMRRPIPDDPRSGSASAVYLVNGGRWAG